MHEEWWYSTGKSEKGPVSMDALRKMLVEGSLSANSLVWREGMAAWAPVAEVTDLNQATRALPPEPPRLTEREQLISLPLAGPWRRFFARLIDLWVIALPTAFIVSYALASYSLSFALWMQRPESEYIFGWLLVPLVLAIEGIIFGLFGTTVGKGLLGVKVTTVSALRPTASQYFQRLVGVYWYGLGTGFPFVNLFTMARQYGRLDDGKQAGYDEGRFNVKAKAPKLGALRLIAALVVIVVLFSANAMLQSMSRESGRSYYSGTTWTNEVTGGSVSVPKGWIYEKQQNHERQPVHIFFGPDIEVYVVFAKEDVHPSLEISEYTKAWIAAVQGTMRLSPLGQPVFVNGHPALRVTGSMADDKTQRVAATLVKMGRQVWRVVLLGTSGREPASSDALKLQEILFSSID